MGRIPWIYGRRNFGEFIRDLDIQTYLRSIVEYKSKIRFPVFDYIVHLIVTDDVTASRQKFDYELGSYDHDAHTIGMYSWPDNNNAVGYLFLDSALINYGTIAHEAWHCVRIVLERAGAKLENEVVAYHLEYIVNEIHKFLQKKKIRVSVL